MCRFKLYSALNRKNQTLSKVKFKMKCYVTYVTMSDVSDIVSNYFSTVKFLKRLGIKKKENTC